MKKVFFALTFMVYTFNIKAAILTVSNDPLTPAQYNNIQFAHNAANQDDTLLVYGSYDLASGTGPVYGTLSISKRLNIIGPGFHSINNNSKVAKFPNGFNFNSGSEGSLVSGLFVDISASVYCSVSHITIMNCHLGYVNINVIVDSIIIRDNVIIEWINGNASTNIFIENNLFIASGTTISNFNQASCLITNNVFIGMPLAGGGVFASVTNALISNNIFYGIRSYDTGSSLLGCVFNNNLSFQTTDNILPPQSATGTGNLINQDPLFTQINLPGYLNYSDDYRLLVSSPGHNAGTDGTDIGIYGGSIPILDSPLTGMAAIPYISIFNIANSVIQQNTNLNVHFKAYKHD